MAIKKIVVFKYRPNRIRLEISISFEVSNAQTHIKLGNIVLLRYYWLFFYPFHSPLHISELSENGVIQKFGIMLGLLDIGMP